MEKELFKIILLLFIGVNQTFGQIKTEYFPEKNGKETRVIKANFTFQNENELIIDKFIYTLAQIPFPNNLTSGKFIKETKTNN